MKQKKTILALLLVLALLTLAGCQRQTTVGPEQPTDSAADEVSQEPDESEDAAGSLSPEDPDSAPRDSAWDGTVPAEEDAVLTVNGQELPAVRYHSALGYSIVYPGEQITLNDWGEGETFGVTEATGTYLAVSQMWGNNISEAVAAVQFEHAVEDEPKGLIFGSAGYAGVSMTQTAGGLQVEYMLVQQDSAIYLVERAIFTGGEDYADLLQAMLDSFTIE